MVAKFLGEFAAIFTNTRSLVSSRPRGFRMWRSPSKHVNSKVQKRTMNRWWNTETHKTDRNLACVQAPLPSGKIGGGVPSQIFPEGRGVCTQANRNPPITDHCFLRGPLGWLTAAKYANVSWPLNFRVRVFLKSAVKAAILNSASRILQGWSYYVKINSARHQHDTERTQNSRERDCSHRQLFRPLWGSSVWRNNQRKLWWKISAHSDLSPDLKLSATTESRQETASQLSRF